MSDQFEGEQPEGPDGPSEPVRESQWWARGQDLPTRPIGEPGGPAGTRPDSVQLLHRPDPGSPGIARIAVVVATLLFIVVAVLQQLAVATPPAPPPTAPVAAAEPPPFQFELVAKLYTRIYHAVPDGQIADSAIAGLEGEATLPEDRLRIAIVEADLKSTEQALERLAAIEEELDGALAEDAAALRLIWQDRRDELSPDEVDQLITNHAWFGELALTHGLPNHHQDRAALVGGGILLIGVLLALFGGGLAGVITGFVLLTLGIVWFSTGRLRTRFRPPAPGGSVAIETVAVFIGAFLLLHISRPLLTLIFGDELSAFIGMMLHWALLLTLLWPVVRGVRWRDALALWGMHRGQGFLKEIGCGIVGYIACLPFLVMGVVITLFLMLVYQAIRQFMGLPAPAPPRNPIFEVVSQRGWAMIVLLFLLASVWAPLAEEAIFRGALYRYLRARWHWLAVAIVTAFIFGFMHSYPFLMLGPVIALGFGFALLREWRGSLIAPITAHAIHNTVVVTILVTMLTVLG